MEKLYDRIDWSNNTTPAINETNLNAMSKAIDDIDDRVIEIAGEAVEASTYATAAAGSASEAATYANNASNYATNASSSATTANSNMLTSEGYALGTQNGVAVSSDSPYYENNAKYYCEHAFSTTPEGYEALVNQVETNTTDISNTKSVIGSSYNASTNYAAGDRFTDNGVRYKVNVPCIGITPPNANYYEVLSVDEDTKELESEIDTLNSSLTNNFSVTSNENLVDNAWFTINQRGSSSYSAYGYTYDRWRLDNSILAISKSNDIITISSDGTAWANCIQPLDDSLSSHLKGRTVTLSIMLSDGTVESATAVFPSSTPTADTTIIGITGMGSTGNVRCVLYYKTSLGYYDVRVVLPSASDTYSFSFKAIKLEIGSVSTLANDTAPNYQQELAKCQRYFQNLNLLNYTYVPLGYAFGERTTAVYLVINLPTAMRDTPSITMSGTLQIKGNSTSYSVSTYSARLDKYGGGSALKLYLYDMSVPSDLVINEIYYIGFSGDTGVLQLSADL